MDTLEKKRNAQKFIFSESDTLAANKSFINLTQKDTDEIMIKVVYSMDEIMRAWKKAVKSVAGGK